MAPSASLCISSKHLQSWKEGRHELEYREKHWLRFAGWTAEQLARVDHGVQSTHAVILTWAAVAPVHLFLIALVFW